MASTALTQAEFEGLVAWVESNKTQWPQQFYTVLVRMIDLYRNLAHDKKKSADIIKTLRMAMGIIPTSESGKQLLSPR